MSKKKQKSNGSVKDHYYRKLKKKFPMHYEFMEKSYKATVVRKDLGRMGYSYAVVYEGKTMSGGVTDEVITDEEFIKKAKYSCLNWLLQQSIATRGNYVSNSAE